MRLAWICLVACGSQPDPVAKSAEPAKPTGIPKLVPKPGDKLETIEVGTIDGKPDPKRAHVSTHRRRTLEVLDTDAGIVTRARIHYEHDEQTATIWDQPIEDKPLVDDDYFAAWSDGKLALTRSDVAPIDPERQRRLLDDVRGYVGQPDFLLAAVAGKSLPDIGAVITLPADRMGDSLGDRCTVRQASARLLQVNRTTATFEEVITFHAVDRETPYDVTALMLVDVSLTTGRRKKQTTFATLAWSGMTFDLKDELRYRYFSTTK